MSADVLCDLRERFRAECGSEGLDWHLSADMPRGFEDAFGTCDPTTRTVHLNVPLLGDLPEYERLFHLYHELRHAAQYAHPERFGELIVRSLSYAVGYDGVCFRLYGNEWRECRLGGSQEYFTGMYLGQPNERDANEYALSRVREIFGEAKGIGELAAMWTPAVLPGEDEYERLYEAIDEKTK